MKARLGLFLLIGSLLSKVAGELFRMLNLSTSTFFWSLSSVLWTLGLLILLVKALNYPKLKEFLDA
jgi:hypothetical protein